MRFVPCYVPAVHCKNPHKVRHSSEPFPIRLPLASHAETLSDQNPLPRDNRPVTLLCPECNCVCDYRAVDVHRYQEPRSGLAIAKDQDPLAVCFQFLCAANNCGFPLRLYVICKQLEEANPRLRDELARRLRAATFQTTCPNGHPLQFPNSDDFQMTWGIACWPPLRDLL
jgi:hypothetical protein